MNAPEPDESRALSILLLCWNHAAFLEDCITALARQSSQDFEIVFLDNVSTDGSFAVAQSLFDRFGLTATMLRNDSPQPISANFNRLLAASKGRIVAPLSTDDWYDDSYVESLLEAERAAPKAGWFSCSGWLFFDQERRSVEVDESDFVTDRPIAEVFLDGRDPHFFVGCAYRRTALAAVGGWDEQQLIEDRDLFLRLAQGFDHCRIEQRLVHYRKSSAAASANIPFMLEGWERFLAKHREAFGAGLTRRQSETYRAYAACLGDQGKAWDGLKLLVKSLMLHPTSAIGWRTALYLGRTLILGVPGQR